MNLRTMLRQAGLTGCRLALACGLTVAALLTGAEPAVAADVNLEFTTPTNPALTTVTVDIGTTKINVPIPPGTSAPQKRNLIRDAINANAVPKFTVEDDGPTGLTIKFLTRGTKVVFSPGATGEEREEIVAGQILTGDIDWGTGFYNSVDANGDPSQFTAGVITDLGEAEVTLTADDLAALDGTTIAAALFAELLLEVAGLGVSLVNLGSTLAFTFDQALTEGGGVIFGTTALSEGLSGSVVVDAPEPASLALAGLGMAAVGLGARRRKAKGLIG